MSLPSLWAVVVQPAESASKPGIKRYGASELAMIAYADAFNELCRRRRHPDRAYVVRYDPEPAHGPKCDHGNPVGQCLACGGFPS